MVGTSRLASVAAAMTLLAACSAGSGDTSGSTGDAAAPDTDGSSPSSAETPAQPSWQDGVEPATGRKVDTLMFTLRLPQGFRPAQGTFVRNSMYEDDNGSLVRATAAPGSTPMTLDEAVAFVLRHDSTEPPPKRRADLEVDGRTVAHLSGRDRIYRERVDLFVTDIGGNTMALRFSVTEDSVDREALWKSTLATLEWK